MNLYDPNTIHLIDDNGEALGLIKAEGVLHLMVPQPGCNSTFYPYATDTHWCLASYHHGHELPKDNGYVVMMLPKSTHTKAEAMNFFMNVITETTECGIYIKHL